MLSPPCCLQDTAIAIDSSSEEDREAGLWNGVGRGAAAARHSDRLLDLADTVHHDKDTKDSVRFKVGGGEGGSILLIICCGLWILGGGTCL